VLNIAGDARTIASIHASIQASYEMGGLVDLSGIDRRPETFVPKHLLDIERGRSVLLASQGLVKHHQFQELGQNCAVVVTLKARDPIADDNNTKKGRSLKKMIKSKDIRDFDTPSEVGMLDALLLFRLRLKIISKLDEINSLRLSRQLQYYMPLQSAYDSYIISQLIQALEGNMQASETNFILNVAFKSHNISRIILQIVGPDFDFSGHDHQMVSWGRLSNMASRFPLPGISPLPATENFMSTRNYIFWLSSILGKNSQEFYMSNQAGIKAQNLGAGHKFEVSNRNRFGTYAGRKKTNDFRSENRFPSDQLIIKAFLFNPISTMVDYGAVYTIRMISKHWDKILSDDSTHFANELMEQLDPFEAMRVYMPAVCIVLSSLRGQNSWDEKKLGPFVRKCQELRPALTADKCRKLVRNMQENILVDLCGGIALIYDPLLGWLTSILKACDMIEREAREVYQKITAVEIGIRLGYDLVTQVNWEIPEDKELLAAIVLHIQGKSPGKEVRERSIRDATRLMTPRDSKTLTELVKKNQADSKPAKILLNRTRALLKRQLRREYLNEAIRHLSMGEYTEDIVHEEWYWIEEEEKKDLYIFDEEGSTEVADRFIHVSSGIERFLLIDDNTPKFRMYIPVAEAISRAQRCRMNIELEHGEKFRYNAFMEFTFLRVALRQLYVISLLFCQELDGARMTILQEMQRMNLNPISVRYMVAGETYYIYNEKMKYYEPYLYEREYSRSDPEWKRLSDSQISEKPPQSIILIGSGPSGLITAIHCAENVLASGGIIKLYTASDEGAPTFEQAQIIRLDNRWIAMLRYYLGTFYEDAFVPTSETDAILGNTL
jgi:hypothetical protein